jgi:hypothetical protein
LSQALPQNVHLQQLRLTFNHDISPSLASTLLQAIAQHGTNNSKNAKKQQGGGREEGRGGGLTSLKLYGLDLSPVMTDVALVVRACQGSLTELRLTRCHLKNTITIEHDKEDNNSMPMPSLGLLTTAIYETNCLQVLDLSMNEIVFSSSSVGDQDGNATTATAAAMTQLLDVLPRSGTSVVRCGSFLQIRSYILCIRYVII